jgi:hypothetical protein
VVLFVAASMLTSNLLRGLRIDLTENSLFTLSEGTRNVLAGIGEPVTLYFYFSQASSRDLPQVRSYARRVDELLQEFESKAAGKITVSVCRPRRWAAPAKPCTWASPAATRWTRCRSCRSCSPRRRSSWNTTWPRWSPRSATPTSAGWAC